MPGPVDENTRFFLKLQRIAEEMEDDFLIAQKAQKNFPGHGSGPMGLTPDAVRASPEYAALEATAKLAWNRLRDLNGFIGKHYRRERNQARSERMRARQAYIDSQRGGN